ncbi:hypothetical protein ACXPVS_26920 [Pseudomonas sp. Ma2-10]
MEESSRILQVINGYLGDCGLILRQGKVVDATQVDQLPRGIKNRWDFRPSLGNYLRDFRKILG